MLIHRMQNNVRIRFQIQNTSDSSKRETRAEEHRGGTLKAKSGLFMCASQQSRILLIFHSRPMLLYFERKQTAKSFAKRGKTKQKLAKGKKMMARARDWDSRVFCFSISRHEINGFGFKTNKRIATTLPDLFHGFWRHLV